MRSRRSVSPDVLMGPFATAGTPETTTLLISGASVRDPPPVLGEMLEDPAGEGGPPLIINTDGVNKVLYLKLLFPLPCHYLAGLLFLGQVTTSRVCVCLLLLLSRARAECRTLLPRPLSRATTHIFRDPAAYIFSPWPHLPWDCEILHRSRLSPFAVDSGGETLAVLPLPLPPPG